MKIGEVTGAVWATRKAEGLEGQPFLVVRANGEEIVAADQVGAGAGDCVLVAFGTAASRCCGEVPVDAVVVAIIDTKKE